MNKIKDLAEMSIFFYCMIMAVILHNYFTIIVIGIISSIFIIEYVNLKIYNYWHHIKFKKRVRKLLKYQNKNFSEFLTHDIKNPTLAQLHGLALLKKNKISSEQNELIEQIENSCSYILNIISAIINSYKLNSKTYIQNQEKFNLKELIRECLCELSILSDEKNLTFVLSQIHNCTFIETDKNDMKKLIKNVLICAINHSCTNGEINIKTKISDKSLIFTVTGMELHRELNKNFFNNTENIKYTPIGQNVYMHFMQNIIKFYKGQIFSSFNKNVNNTYTFIIPCYTKNSAFNNACLYINKCK